MKISKELRQQLIDFLEQEDERVVKSMLDQLKYKKRGRKVGWRKPVG